MSPSTEQIDALFRQWWLESYPAAPGVHAAMTHTGFAAWLLQRQQLEPVVLAERGPTADDTDARGRCWYGTTEGGSTLWGLQLEPVALSDTHWLPYWALPDLEGES